MISIDQSAEGTEMLCIHVSRDLCELFEPVVKYNMFRILENEMKDIERWLKRGKNSIEQDIGKEGSIDKRNFFVHAGLARGLVKISAQDGKIQVCKELGDRVHYVDTVIE